MLKLQLALVVMLSLMIGSCESDKPRSHVVNDASFLLAPEASWPTEIIRSKVYVRPLSQHDGRMGPIDYAYFVRIDVDLRLIESWYGIFPEIQVNESAAPFIPPDDVPAWWSQHGKIYPELQAPRLLKYGNTWISIDAFTGVVLVYSRTT